MTWASGRTEHSEPVRERVPGCVLPRGVGSRSRDLAPSEEPFEGPPRLRAGLVHDHVGGIRSRYTRRSRSVRLGPLRWITVLEKQTIVPAGTTTGMPGSAPK